jgi:hypothetical protein
MEQNYYYATVARILKAIAYVIKLSRAGVWTYDIEPTLQGEWE